MTWMIRSRVFFSLIAMMVFIQAKPVKAISLFDTWDIQIAPPTMMVGTWEGVGDNLMNVEYCKQRKISFYIVIGSTGRVSGTIGDATIIEGTFQRVAWFKRWFGSPEYRILFTLSGPIVAKEKFVRESGILMLDPKPIDKMIGTFESDKGSFGSETRTMTVVNINYTHVY